MIPDLHENGKLPPGIHWAMWDEFQARFGWTPYRRRLLNGLKDGLLSFKAAGCQTAYVDGSFITSKEVPGDFDCCWDEKGVDPTLLDTVLLDFRDRRAAQKAKYLGEFLPATCVEGRSGKIFLDFFAEDKETGDPKGIVAIDLRGL
jgi:hypothetical protein